MLVHRSCPQVWSIGGRFKASQAAGAWHRRWTAYIRRNGWGAGRSHAHSVGEVLCWAYSRQFSGCGHMAMRAPYQIRSRL